MIHEISEKFKNTKNVLGQLVTVIMVRPLYVKMKMVIGDMHEKVLCAFEEGEGLVTLSVSCSTTQLRSG